MQVRTVCKGIVKSAISFIQVCLFKLNGLCAKIGFRVHRYSLPSGYFPPKDLFAELQELVQDTADTTFE